MARETGDDPATGLGLTIKAVRAGPKGRYWAGHATCREEVDMCS